MNAEIWFFFTPDGKSEITVLDKESAQAVAQLMSHEQRRLWKCRRNRSQEAWFVHECHELVGSVEASAPQPRHSEIPQRHVAVSNEEALGHHHIVPPSAPAAWQTPPQNWSNAPTQQSHPAWQPPVAQPQAPQHQQPGAPQPVAPQPQAWQQPAAPQPQAPQPQPAWQPPQQNWQQPAAPAQHQPPPAWQAPVQSWQNPQQPQPAAPPPAHVEPPAQPTAQWPAPAASHSAPSPANGGREKRRYQRIGLRLRVVLIAGNRSFRTYSKDVSKGGMSFEHIVPKELIGQNCKVIIGSADMKENLEFEARIAGDPHNPRAVEFQDAKAHFLSKLEQWLEDAKRAA